MSKIKIFMLSLILCFSLCFTCYAHPVIPLTNSGNCGYFAWYYSYNTFGVHLPINNNYLSEWQNLKNLGWTQYDYAVKDSVMLFTPQDLGVSYGHVAIVTSVYMSANGQVVLTKESGTYPAPAGAKYMNGCWYREGWYYTAKYPNTKYIKIVRNSLGG